MRNCSKREKNKLLSRTTNIYILSSELLLSSPAEVHVALEGIGPTSGQIETRYVVYLFLSLYRKALQSKIVKLQSHISHLEALTSYEVPFNYGKPIDEVKDRQKARKLEIRDGSKKALNFIQSYDADVVSLTVRSRKSGATQVLSLDKSPTPSSLESPSTSNKQVPVDEVLYLLDHYGVSDHFYHELSMAQPSLPRSYLVKRRG